MLVKVREVDLEGRPTTMVAVHSVPRALRVFDGHLATRMKGIVDPSRITSTILNGFDADVDEQTVQRIISEGKQ